MNFSPALVTEEHPLQIKEEISTEILGLDAATARAEKPIGVELTVQKDEEDFVATGWATTSLSLLCGRCAGWMPWPVAALLKSPSITLILPLTGSSGDKVLLSFISEPEPSALQ